MAYALEKSENRCQYLPKNDIGPVWKVKMSGERILKGENTK